MNTPNVDGFTSEPILFWVGGRRYGGHYHRNGCYYNDCGSEKELFAACDPAAFKNHFGRVCEYPEVERWEYLNEP